MRLHRIDSSQYLMRSHQKHLSPARPCPLHEIGKSLATEKYRYQINGQNERLGTCRFH